MLIFVVGFAGLVAAGPFEDAAAAYGRGDYATAIRLWRPLANQGNAAAQYYLGTMYGNGYGVPVDSAAWKSWWRRAADGGYAAAQMMLGRLYEDGLSVPLDYAIAMSWWRRAADQGYAEAQYHLGFMYQYGMGVPQDYSAAARWYRMAANQGNTHWRIVAQQNLDRMANAALPPASENRNPSFQIGVPLKKDRGTFVVPVQINGTMTLDFVIDSGATDVTVPADVVSTLMRAGTIKETEFIGQQTYVLADGSKSKSATFTVRSLRVGDMVLENVRVASPQGSLLLGQSFLERFKSWSIDNTKHELFLEPR